MLKNRLNKEGNETVTNCNQLKMIDHDGKMRLTDVLDIEDVLKLVQSIPSSKAEPFKLWLAKQGENVAKSAKKQIKLQTSEFVVTDENFLPHRKKPQIEKNYY